MDRMRHGRPVRLAAHDDAHLRRRCAHFSTLLPRRFIAAPPPSDLAAGGQRPVIRRAFTDWYEVVVIIGRHTDRRRRAGGAFGYASGTSNGQHRGGTDRGRTDTLCTTVFHPRRNARALPAARMRGSTCLRGE